METKRVPLKYSFLRKAGSPAVKLLLALLGLPGLGYGQGVTGFSGQTQPSIVVETQYVDRKKFMNAHNAQKSHSLTVEPGYVKDVPPGDINIDDATTLLSEYDDMSDSAGYRTGLGQWRVGIVSDGDFNKIATSTTAPSAKAGSLGVDAVWMRPVYYKYTYTAESRPGREIKNLVGEQTIRRPLLAFNTLVVLFSGTPTLTTGVAANALPGTRATLAQQRVFGQALLVPDGYISGTGLSFTSNFTWFIGTSHPNTTFLKNLALAGTVNMVQTNWSSRDVTTAVNILAPSIGLNYRLIEAYFKVGEQNNYVQVQPFARYTMRYLFGDVEYNGQLLADAIGTEGRDFHAFDLGVALTINAVRLTANVPVFYGADIVGFTHGQPIIGFGLAATIRFTD